MTLLLLVACAPSAPSRPDNVLLLTLDTLRADHLGAYGATTGATPTLDRIAHEGVRFTNAYTVTPLTIPAHASIHTGLWPPVHGVEDNGELFLRDDANTLAEAMKAGGRATMASVGAEVTSHHWGFAQGFDRFYDDIGSGGTGSRRWTAERRGSDVVQDALVWLEAHASDERPWFVWVHLYDAHDPYDPPEPYRTTFKDDPYTGEVATVDHDVGLLVAELERLGQLDHTWIVAVGDHGESLGEHGETTHGVLLYDATTRVPFLVRPPTRSGGCGGAARGTAIDAPVSLVDVMPTALAAAGLPVPDGLDGVNLLPVLSGGAAADRAVYAESLYAWRHFGWAPQRALMTSAFTLLDSTTPELYAAGDRAQTTPLSDANTLGTLRERLATMRAAMDARATSAATAPDGTSTADRTAMLESLGYLTGESTAGRDADGKPLAGLPDPVKRLPVLAQVEKAQRAWRAGDLETARATAEAAVAADPGLVETQMLLATILWKSGKPEDAQRVVTAVDERLPTSQTRHLLGLLALTLGHPDDAVRLLADAVARDPNNAAANEEYLQTLLVVGDTATLRTAADAAHVHLPDSAVVTGMTGVAHALTGDPGGARPLLDDAIRRNPRQPFVHHALGVVAEATGDAKLAADSYAEEIRLFPPATASRRALDALRGR